MSNENLFEFRRKQLLSRIPRNQKLLRWVAILVIGGALAFIASRFMSEQATPNYVFSGLGLLACAGGAAVYIVLATRWRRSEKCPACGERFWGSSGQPHVGFSTATTKCMYCGYSPLDDDAAENLPDQMEA